MFSRLKNINKLFITSFMPIFRRGPDETENTSGTAIALSKALRDVELTPKDRLYIMFSTDEFGEPSPELVFCGQITVVSFLVGCGIGGFIQSRVAFLNFVESNDSSKFSHHMEAKKLLQDKVTLGFAKGAWRWGWRLAAFSGSYTFFTNVISVYRGKNGIIEHVFAGSLAGMAYKMNLGIRGIVVGGCLGGVLGTICGLCYYGAALLTGTTMTDLTKVGYWARRNRNRVYEEAISQHVAQEDNNLIRQYNARVGPENITLASISSTSNVEIKK